MNKEFKKNFFTCLLAVLLVISNLFCKKLTNFMDTTISIEFLTFPFTFLCTLLIVNLGDKKEAYRSLLSASIIQLLITISYTIAINIGNNVLVSDDAMYFNQVFQVNQYNILSSVLAFILSHCLLIYIYDNFRKFGKELYGIIIGLLGSLFLNSVIYLTLVLKDYEFIYIVNMLYYNIIINCIMILIITIMFYILKDKKKENIVIKEDKEISTTVKSSISDNKIKISKTETKKNTNSKNNNNKRNTNSKNNTKKNNSTRKNSNSKNNVKNSNRKSASKNNVNKKNN